MADTDKNGERKMKRFFHVTMEMEKLIRGDELVCQRIKTNRLPLEAHDTIKI